MPFNHQLAAYGLRAIAVAIDATDPDGAKKLREQAGAIADKGEGLYDVVALEAEKPAE